MQDSRKYSFPKVPLERGEFLVVFIGSMAFSREMHAAQERRNPAVFAATGSARQDVPQRRINLLGPVADIATRNRWAVSVFLELTYHSDFVFFFPLVESSTDLTKRASLTPRSRRTRSSMRRCIQTRAKAHYSAAVPSGEVCLIAWMTSS